MFDVTQSTKVKQAAITPNAATKERPRRVDVGGEVYWLRPSNVLRIEVLKANTRGAEFGWSESARVAIMFSDNKYLICSCETGDRAIAVADAMAALLWPSLDALNVSAAKEKI